LGAGGRSSDESKELRRRKKRIVEAYLYQNTLDKETYQRPLGLVEEDLTLVELYPYDAKVDEVATLSFQHRW
jgi:hypothetical protein